jgi:glycosyltransferase involved in cell wall biosynthesis
MISVVVCTYNRSDLIKGCLDSLINQSANLSTFEVLVIDNNSTDETHQIVANYLSFPNFRMFREENQGLSHARNRGIREANGEYIAFLDDDARVHLDYIKTAELLISHAEQPINCLGGPILPFYTTPKPVWFKDQYETRRDWDKPKFLVRGQSFSGSNSIWSKSTLSLINGFDINAGVKGEQMILGEDTSAFEKLWQLNDKPRLFYSPGLIVYHWVPDYKMTTSYKLRRSFAGGQYLAGINRFNLRKFERILKLMMQNAIFFIRGLTKIISHRHWQNWVYEEWSGTFQNLGEIFGLLNLRLNLSQRK